MGSILVPYNVLDRRSVKLGNGFLLLDVVKYNRTRGAENEAGSATKKDFVRLNRWFDTLDGSPGQIADLDKLHGDYWTK